MAGELVRLECGRTREEVVEHLVGEAARDPDLVVGLDFAFSLPAWYLGDRSPKELWRQLAEERLTPAMGGDLGRWLEDPEPPFWVRNKDSALAGREPFRRTDYDARRLGSQPKSVFQLVGAGAVGRGSLRGMQALHRLSAGGFSVWPFDRPALPLVVEVFPRLFMGTAVKTSVTARASFLAEHYPSLRLDLTTVAAASDDAFDAAVSALAMDAAGAELACLPTRPEYRREGAIWWPSTTIDPPDRRERAARMVQIRHEAVTHAPPSSG
jgi:hypothetical protein